MPLQRRVPKRGFNNIFKKQFSLVNVGDLERVSAVNEVSPELIVKSGLIKKIYDGIKLLAKGEIDKALTVRVHKASAAAISKVEAAGGRVELISAEKG